MGSSLASRLMARTSLRVEGYMQIVFAVSAAYLILPILTIFVVSPTKEKGGGISFAGSIQLLASDFNCIVINWTRTIPLVVLRSLNDLVYFLNILLQFRLAYVSASTGSRVIDIVDHPKEIAMHYLHSYFLLDLFVVIPLPQIIILFVLPKYLGSSGANHSKNLISAVILVQYIPRLFRFSLQNGARNKDVGTSFRDETHTRDQETKTGLF
ncbi:hypothetical protein HN873_036156 [Arachis hypogaea]